MYFIEPMFILCNSYFVLYTVYLTFALGTYHFVTTRLMGRKNHTRPHMVIVNSLNLFTTHQKVKNDDDKIW